MVNGLLKNKESPSSRGPAGCRARNGGSRGDAMDPPCTPERARGAPPGSRRTAPGRPPASSPHPDTGQAFGAKLATLWAPQTREGAASARPTPCGPGGFASSAQPTPPLPVPGWVPAQAGGRLQVAGDRQGQRGWACEKQTGLAAADPGHLAPPPDQPSLHGLGTGYLPGSQNSRPFNDSGRPKDGQADLNSRWTGARASGPGTVSGAGRGRHVFPRRALQAGTCGGGAVRREPSLRRREGAQVL